MKLDFNQVMASSADLLERAAVELRDRWKADPGNWQVGWKLAETSRQLGQLDGALASYSQVLKLNPACTGADYISRIFSGRDLLACAGLATIPVPFVITEDLMTKVQLGKVWECILGNRDEFMQSATEEGVNLKNRSSKVLADSHQAAIRTFILQTVRKSLKSAWPRLGLIPFKTSGEEIQLTSHSAGDFLMPTWMLVPEK